MSITSFYNRTVNTQRLSLVTGSNRTTFQSNLTGVVCAIHPLNPEQAVSEYGAIYRVFKMFCSNSYDILVGDRVIDGSTTYTVKAVSLMDDVASENTHIKVILYKGE